MRLAIDEPAMAVELLHHDLTGVELVLNLADDFLKDVLQCDHALRAAVFVHDNRHRVFLLAKVPQQLGDAHRVGYEIRQLNHLIEFTRRVDEKLFDVEDAFDRVGRVVNDGNPTMFDAAQRRGHFPVTERVVHTLHIHPRSHDLLHLHLFEGENLVHHVPLFLADDAGALAHGEQRAVFVLGRGARPRLAGREIREPLDRSHQAVGKRLGGAPQQGGRSDGPLRRARQKNRQEFGVTDRESFWRDFAEQQDQRRHGRHRERLGPLRRDCLEHAVADDGRADVDDGVTKQNRREKSVRLVEQLADDLALPGMFLAQTPHLQLAEREQGGLRTREERRESQERAQAQQFQNQRDRQHQPRRKSMKLACAASTARRGDPSDAVRQPLLDDPQTGRWGRGQQDLDLGGLAQLRDMIPHHVVAFALLEQFAKPVLHFVKRYHLRWLAVSDQKNVVTELGGDDIAQFIRL